MNASPAAPPPLPSHRVPGESEPQPAAAGDARRGRRLERIQGLGHILDTSIRIPGTSIRFGLDPVIGLIPGLGDALGTALSGYIIIEAARFGGSRSLLLRMLSNVGLEAVVGLVPGIGDVFDAVWKSNTRNLRLLERHLQQPEAASRASRTYLALVFGGLAILVGVSLAGLVWLGAVVIRLLGA